MIVVTFAIMSGLMASNSLSSNSLSNIHQAIFILKHLSRTRGSLIFYPEFHNNGRSIDANMNNYRKGLYD